MLLDNKIQIGSSKNIKSVNTDITLPIYLKSKISHINEFDINEVIDANDVFIKEREENVKYNIYGRIEYLSLLNGLKNNYSKLTDFFDDEIPKDSKNLKNSFDFYLLKPSSSGYTKNKIPYTDEIDLKNEEEYVRRFEIIATPDEIDIVNAGFSKNIFNEQVFAFVVNKTIDLTNIFDYFGHPITDLFLYVKYITKGNEELHQWNWNSDKFEYKTEKISSGRYSLNQTIRGDIIVHNKKEYKQKIGINKKVEIRTKYGSMELRWNYNPFIRIPIREFSNSLNIVNINDSEYNTISNIPKYIKPINGIATWRDIQPEGYLDKDNKSTLDHPFVNGTRYVFSSIIFPVTPDLDHTNTKNVFNEINFEKNVETSSVLPQSDLDDINKPCI